MQTVGQQIKASHVPASLASRVKASQVVTCPPCTNPTLGVLKTPLGPVGAWLASILYLTSYAWIRTKDVCSLNPDICGVNSHCITTVGGYLCSCKKGYDRYPPLYNCTPVSNCKGVCGDRSTCQWIEENQSFGCSYDMGCVELMSGGCVQMKFILM